MGRSCRQNMTSAGWVLTIRSRYGAVCPRCNVWLPLAFTKGLLFTSSIFYVWNMLMHSQARSRNSQTMHICPCSPIYIIVGQWPNTKWTWKLMPTFMFTCHIHDSSNMLIRPDDRNIGQSNWVYYHQRVIEWSRMSRILHCKDTSLHDELHATTIQL